MILKNILRILKSYKFALINIIFFELIYLIKGYKGNNVSFSNNSIMADNIPCPYFFLFKIKKNLKKNYFQTFIDLGCGSGRVIDFFNRNFSSKKFIGIEYFPNQYEHCKIVFQDQHNTKIVQADFTKSNFSHYDADCYFFNNPFKNDSDIIGIVEKINNFTVKGKKILFIFVNFDKKIIERLKIIQCIESYNINDHKGYSIYCLNNK